MTSLRCMRVLNFMLLVLQAFYVSTPSMRPRPAGEPEPENPPDDHVRFIATQTPELPVALAGAVSLGLHLACLLYTSPSPRDRG
eukprot:3943053-Amphidinium_carterae.1